MKNILLILFGISLSSSAFEAIVTAVTDGDTVKIEYQNKTIKVRLAGIDTPELKQEFGTESKRALEDKVLNKMVYIDGEKEDRYGRLIADLRIGSRWINIELIEEGYAWHYKQYSKNTDLAKAESSAKKEAKGLWVSHNPIPPWEYRRSNSLNLNEN